MPQARLPLDSYPYQRDPRSRLIGIGLPDGPYVYVRDTAGFIHVVPDGPHLHPRVLGNAAPAWYAGDLTLAGDEVVDLTNLSGTFQFDDREGLLDVARVLAELGFEIRPNAVRFFPMDGSSPYILQ
ncbi:MAG: hypothetical protein R3C10_03400 [Pirellulales bacterium]